MGGGSLNCSEKNGFEVRITQLGFSIVERVRSRTSAEEISHCRFQSMSQKCTKVRAARPTFPHSTNQIIDDNNCR